MKEHRHNADEELKDRRQRDLAALQARTDRVSEAPRTDSDQVGIEFDWEVPASAGDPIVFQARISREGRESSIRFALDQNRLQTNELQSLYNFLANPPKGYWLARSVTWLIDVSIRQQQPHCSTEERNRKVKELLLAPP
jgi:hypothetical protein